MVEARPAVAADQEKVAAFLHRNLDTHVSPERFARLFRYPWMADKPNCGYVLEESGEIAGFVGAIYSNRQVEGRMERFCNLTSWCVLESHRNHSMKLIAACHRDREQTYTNFSARPVVQKINEALKYQMLGRWKLFLPPLAALTTLGGPAPRVVTGVDAIAPRLHPEHARLLEDHAATQCSHLLAEDASGYCYVISNRRVKKGVPFSEVLYVSAADRFLRHLERIKLRILLLERTPALAVDERLLGCRQPFSYPFERVTMYRSARVPASTVDNLYSELALL